jgi:CubicO group peptidase (beta-lactamase class C family)
VKRIYISLAAAAITLTSLASAQISSPATPESVGLSRERINRIKAALNDYVTRSELAGATALIARRGKIVYFETFGVIDKETGKPMPKDAIFRLNSMTKPILAVGLLTLYEEGKFSFLDPVSKYIPEFKDMKVQIDKTDPATGKHVYSLVPAERQITVLDLLRHTSGMNNQGPKDENGELTYRKLNNKAHTLADGIKMLATLPLVHQPATGFDYSPGPDVAGRLIEIFSGKPLNVYLEERVFKPLGMTDAGFYVPESKWNRLAALYDAGQDGTLVRATREIPENVKVKPIYMSGSNGLVASTMDYYRFAQMLLNGGELNGVRILSPKTVDLMRSDLLGDLPVYGGPMLPGHGFGLTVAVDRGPAKTASVGSTGEYYWEGGSGSDFFVDPKEQLTTVLMIQKRGSIAISRQYKRMVYDTIVDSEK